MTILGEISGPQMVSIAANAPDNIVGFEGGASEYEFSIGSGTGYFTLNGVKQPTDIDVSASQLADLEFVFTQNDTEFLFVADIAPAGYGSDGLSYPLTLTLADIPTPIILNIVLGSNGYGTIAAFKNSQPLPISSTGSNKANVAFDDLMPIPAGSYEVVIYDSPTNGECLIFSDADGDSDFNDRNFIEIHKGNTPGDSAGCIVTGNGIVNGSATNNYWSGLLAYLNSQMPAGTTLTPGSYYTLPEAITVNVSGDTTQPTLKILPASSVLIRGTSENITLKVAGLQPSSPVEDKDIDIYFQVVGTTATASLVTGATLLPNGSESSGGFPLPSGCFEATIDGTDQTNKSPPASASITLNTSGVVADNLTIDIVHYDGTSYETPQSGTINTFNYDPSGSSEPSSWGTQPMLENFAPASITLTTTVSRGQTLNVSSGQTLSGIVDALGAVVNVLFGGTIINTAVSGILNVLSGGTADPTTIYSGGTEIISRGGTDFDAQISGGRQLDYGAAGSVTVFSGAQVVESGGMANGTTVSAGTEIVSAHGTDLGAAIAGGTQIVYGSAGGVIVSGGGQAIASGGTASGTILSGGSETVSAHGTDEGAQIFGGTQSVYGTVSGGTNQAGVELVEAGGRLLGVTIESAGSAIVLAGGVVSSAAVSGVETVSKGGTDISAQVGGAQTIYGLATGAAIVGGGTQTVSSGGVASSTTVASGAQLVAAHGVAVGTTIGNGDQFVAGGTASNTTFTGSLTGYQVVGSASSGGTAIGTKIVSGYQNVDNAGVATSTTISVGGTQIVSGGLAVSTTVSSGGFEIVSSGGTANGTTASSGGTMLVSPGGVIEGTLFANGSTSLIQIAGGAVVSSGTIQIGNGMVEIGGSGNETVSFVSKGSGTLQLDSATLYTGKISGFGVGSAAHADRNEVIDLSAITYSAGVVSDTYSGTTASGVLKVFSGGTTVATLNFAGSYSSSNFMLTSGAGGIGTIITDPSRAAAPPASANAALLGNYMAASFVTTASGIGGVVITETPAAASQQLLLAHPHG